jgi:PucR C-terminal helix-turn-helix domain/GGDEF-like domain
VTAEIAIVSGEEDLGSVLLLGEGASDADEWLHLAAAVALTEVGMVEARDATEQSVRGSFLEELRGRDDLSEQDVLRRAMRLGCDLSAGGSALCVEPEEGHSGRLPAAIAAERPGALAEEIDVRVYALLPGSAGHAEAVAGQLRRHGAVGLSSHYPRAGEMRRALEEAELVLDVLAAGGVPDGGDMGSGTYRLLLRALASHPDEVVSFYDDTLAPVVAYDEQYRTDLVGTLAAYLDEGCNVNATARAIDAQRHTVTYRLERIQELTGLDPLRWDDRERLGVGLKAYRVLAPRLPR